MEIYKKSQILSSLSDEQKIIHQSKHLLLELYRCDRQKLNDESFLRCNLNRAAKLANATVLNLISNKFEPQGGYGNCTTGRISYFNTYLA